MVREARTKAADYIKYIYSLNIEILLRTQSNLFTLIKICQQELKHYRFGMNREKGLSTLVREARTKAQQLIVNVRAGFRANYCRVQAFIYLIMF